MLFKEIKSWKIYLALIAFIIYLVYDLFYLPIKPLFPDEFRFIKEAIHFAKTFEFRVGNDIAFEMPLAGLFYGLIYMFVGNEFNLIITIRIIQAFMLICMAFFVFSITKIAFKNEMASNIAFVWTLFYPFFIYYQALLLSEMLFMFFLVISFYFLYRLKESAFSSKKLLILTMLFFSLATYTKGTLTILAPILVSLFYLVTQKSFKGFINLAISSSLIFILFLSPWWIRNYILLDSFVPFTTSSSANLYLGNNKSNLSGGCDWSVDANREEVAKINSITNEAERNRAYAKAAKEFIVNNPDRFLELAWLKFKRFWNVIPNYSEFSSIYKWIALFSFTPVFFLSIVAIFLTKKRLLEIMPIFVLVLYFTIMHSFIIASLRYRVPIEPFLIILASFSLSYIWSKIVQHRI